MPTGIYQSEEVRSLLRKASGLDLPQGNQRLKSVIHDLLLAIFEVIDGKDVTEDELWRAVTYLQDAAPEFGLLIPGLGIEHFMDLVLDARDEAVMRCAGTPRTIEGPLFVEGAPLSESHADLNRSGDKGTPLRVEGRVLDSNGTAVAGAIIDVWHANAKGAYSVFDKSQPAFNFRGKIKTGKDGRYAFDTVMPSGYSCPPGGATDQLLSQIGRHGSRPAHVHFFVRAPGYRSLTTQINIADDPLVHDDFAFATREGLIPPISHGAQGSHIAFDFVLQQALEDRDETLSRRSRMHA